MIYEEKDALCLIAMGRYVKNKMAVGKIANADLFMGFLLLTQPEKIRIVSTFTACRIDEWT